MRENGSFFESLTLGRFLSTALRNAHTVDTRLLTPFLIVLTIKATIRGQDFGNRTERFLVTCQSGLHMVFIGRVAVQDAILSD
jgi:hypothetical protein